MPLDYLLCTKIDRHIFLKLISSNTLKMWKNNLDSTKSGTNIDIR